MNKYHPPVVVMDTAIGVNRSDYYTDLLVEHLIRYLQKQPKLPRIVLELGTGRGYISIVLKKTFPSIKKIVATDIEPRAVRLAKRNIYLNKLDTSVTVLQGNLFVPVSHQKFDLILSVPPQLPITKVHVRTLIPTVESYHVTTSAGGKIGRSVIDKIISQSPAYLHPSGTLVFVHSDIINFDTTLQKMQSMGFCAKILGTRKKLLAETTLTRLTKSIIEATGYRFRKDTKGREFLTLGVFVGTYDGTYQKYSTSTTLDCYNKSQRVNFMGQKWKRLYRFQLPNAQP